MKYFKIINDTLLRSREEKLWVYDAANWHQS